MVMPLLYKNSNNLTKCYIQTLRTFYLHGFVLPQDCFGVYLSIIKSASDISKSKILIVAVPEILVI